MLDQLTDVVAMGLCFAYFPKHKPVPFPAVQFESAIGEGGISLD